MTTTNLVKENERLKAALEKCRETLKFYASEQMWIDQNFPHGDYLSHALVDKGDEARRVLGQIESPNPQPTQDPTTSIAYGLYPSSARPVNPNLSKIENWVGYTPIDTQSK